MTEEQILEENAEAHGLRESMAAPKANQYAKVPGQFNPKKAKLGINAVYNADGEAIVGMDRATSGLGDFGEKR